jgi:hypothetical protein
MSLCRLRRDVTVPALAHVASRRRRSPPTSCRDCPHLRRDSRARRAAGPSALTPVAAIAHRGNACPGKPGDFGGGHDYYFAYLSAILESTAAQPWAYRWCPSLQQRCGSTQRRPGVSTQDQGVGTRPLCAAAIGSGWEFGGSWGRTGWSLRRAMGAATRQRPLKHRAARFSLSSKSELAESRRAPWLASTRKRRTQCRVRKLMQRAPTTDVEGPSFRALHGVRLAMSRPGQTRACCGLC